MKYEVIKNNITSVKGENDSIGMIVETMELIPKNYAVAFTDKEKIRFESSELKRTLANKIADDLMGNMEHEITPKGLHVYKFSSVVYFKPSEKELYEKLLKEIKLSNKLSEEIFDKNKILNSKWKLFKHFFKVLFK